MTDEVRDALMNLHHNAQRFRGSDPSIDASLDRAAKVLRGCGCTCGLCSCCNLGHSPERHIEGPRCPRDGMPLEFDAEAGRWRCGCGHSEPDHGDHPFAD